MISTASSTTHSAGGWTSDAALSRAKRPAALCEPSSLGTSSYHYHRFWIADESSRMDLHEDSDENTVTATFELPGVKKEDVNLDVHNGRLTISGETKMSEEHEEGGYAVRERRFGKFSRTLQLPQGIKVS
jgi:HSP20 family molecular chaperone IbpA